MPRLKLSKVTENIADIYRRKVADTVIEATKKRITNDSLKLITNISDDMRTHIGKLLRQGEQKGRSVSATASTLLKTGLDKGVFKSARVRAYLIARTELHRARQEAALDLYKASDIKMVKWIVIGDNRLCPVCKAKAQTYNIKDIEDQLPPEHPRCRCRVLPADYQMTVTVKKNKKNKVVEQQILPTPKNYLYVVKVKKFKKALDVDEARGKIEKYFKNVTREQLIKDLEDSGLEKARTLGAKDLVPRQRRYHVTIADGRKVPVTAHHPAEAVSIARKLFNLAVSKVEEIQDLEKARPHKYTRREGTKGHYLYYYTTGQKQTSGIKTVGIGIDTKFKEKGFIDLRGQKVTSASDVAQLAQIYRNPKYETMRYIYVKDGIVVGHEGRSSRIPGQSGAFAKEPARELFELRQRIARLGADTVWLVHNHPSTNPKPSKGDLAITTRLMWDIPEIKGHVIINSGKFGLIERAKGPEGTVPVVPSIQMLPFKPSDEFLKPTVDNPLLGQTVQSGWDVAKVAMALKTPKNFATLLYRSGSTIRAIQEVPIKMLTHYEAMLDYMRGRAREFGAMDVLVAAEQGSLPQEAETTLTKMVMYGQIIDGIIYESNEMQSIRDHTLMGSSGSSREEWMGRPAKTYVTKALEKAKRVYVPAGTGHKAYYRFDPREIEFPKELESKRLIHKLEGGNQRIFVQSFRKESERDWAMVAADPENKKPVVEATLDLNADQKSVYLNRMDSTRGSRYGQETMETILNFLANKGFKHFKGYVENINPAPRTMLQNLGFKETVQADSGSYFELEKAVSYSRFRHGKLEQVKGYPGKPRLHDLTTGEKLDQYLMDPTRPEVTKAMDIIKNIDKVGDHTLMGSSGSSREEWMGRPAKTYVTKGLEKAQPHKYIRRTGVSGHYEYFYDEPGTIRVGGIAFAQPERAKKHGEQVVLVDVAKFDAEWSKDEGFYVGQGGQGASISDRYERFKEFIKIGKPIEMAEVSGRPGHIGFTNGRHRFAVLRDLGLKVIPISVDKESASYMQDTFGASEEDTGWKPKRGQRERLESSQDIQVRHHKLNQIREEYNLGSFGASKVDVTKAVNYVEEEIERWSGKLHFDGRGTLNIEVVKLPQKSGRELRGRYLPLGKILQIDQRFSDSIPHEYAHFIFDANGWRAAWPPRQSVVTGRTYIPTEVRLGFDGFNRTISNADTSEEGKALVELFDSLKEFYASDECAKEINQGFSKVIAMGNIKFEEYRAHYLDYVFRPTEIFARACEMYANGRPGKAAQMVSKTGPISSPESLPGYRDVVTAWGDKYLKTGIVKSLEKAVGYSRFRHGKLEQVKGYTGKPRLHDLTTGEKLDQYLMDPTRPEVTKAMDIIKNIDKVGGRALMVGGCVRDALLGRHSKDIDIEVYGLKPEELSTLLQQHGSVDQVGKSFGVFKVSSPELEEAIDVSLPRRESKTGKGHKGFMVEPDQQMAIKEAASRRDLTINSMAYDPLTKEFVDPFNGLADLKAGKLQATDPTTFPDDSLRVLRVMRFAAQLGFTPTVELARLCRDIDLTDLPKERVFGEFSRMLAKAKHPSIGLQLIPILGIGKILPELTALKGVEQEPDWHPEGDAWTHTLMVVDEAAKIRDRLTDPKEKLIFMLGALCHDLGKPVTTEVQDGKIISHSHDSVGADIATKFLARLTDEPYIVDKVVSLVQNHMRPTFFLQDKVPDSAIRRLAKKVDIPMLVMVSASDKSGRGLKADLKAERWLMRRFKVLGLEHPETLEPRVRGRDLIPLGVPPGPGMGRILDKIYNAQLEGKFETTEQGLEYAKQQGWFLPVEMADTMTKSMRGLTVGYREARSLIRQLRKNRLEDKFIPYREGGDIVWAKHSDNGLILNRPAIKGDTVLMKSGVLATVTAVGKDGITARREGEKFNLFNGTFDVVSK